jgi:acetoin utilization deacetylase AcuC-like enzyme
LYIDIDVHHGDGVEEAFHRTDRVMTLLHCTNMAISFLVTGRSSETGAKEGTGFSVNAPLQEWNVEQRPIKTYSDPSFPKLWKSTNRVLSYCNAVPTASPAIVWGRLI